LMAHLGKLLILRSAQDDTLLFSKKIISHY
jgi:hypothetical protein